MQPDDDERFDGPFRDSSGVPIAYQCSRCAAMGYGRPPHDWDAPCPSAVAADAAYVAKLAAETAYYERASFMANDVGGARKMSGSDDE